MIRKVSSYILFFGVLMLLGCTSVFALPPEEGERHQGIDVSMWQGDIDFNKVAASGVDTVYIRSSLGCDYTDRILRRTMREPEPRG